MFVEREEDLGEANPGGTALDRAPAYPRNMDVRAAVSVTADGRAVDLLGVQLSLFDGVLALPETEATQADTAVDGIPRSLRESRDHTGRNRVTEPAALQVEIQLRNGSTIETNFAEIAEDASDEEITEAIHKTLTAYAHRGWLVIGDVVVQALAVEAVVPR